MEVVPVEGAGGGPGSVSPATTGGGAQRVGRPGTTGLSFYLPVIGQRSLSRAPPNQLSLAPQWVDWRLGGRESYVIPFFLGQREDWLSLKASSFIDLPNVSSGAIFIYAQNWAFLADTF